MFSKGNTLAKGNRFNAGHTRNRLDLVGKTFGRLVVIDFAGTKQAGKNPKNKVSMWRCRCECGGEIVTRGASLVKGDSKSCGCLQREMVSINVVRRMGLGEKWDPWGHKRKKRLLLSGDRK